MPNFFYDKRKSLLDFVREQLIGPNSYNGRFGQDEWPVGEPFNGDNSWICGEVIDTTPGNVYCSAILFPKKDSSLLDRPQQDPNTPNRPNKEDSPFSPDESVGDEQTDNGGFVSDETVENDDSYDINQRYPQTCGISCCLSPDIIRDNDLSIVISGRYYTKIQDLSSIYVIVEEQDIDAVRSLLDYNINNGDGNTLLSSYFRISENRLYLTKTSKRLHTVIKQGLDEYNKQQSAAIRRTDLSWQNQERELFLASYKEYLFQKRYQNKRISEQEREDVKQRIERVEQVERALSYYSDLLSALDSRGYGFWRSEDFHVPIDLSDLSFDLNGRAKKIYRPTDSNKLKDIISRSFGRISRNDDGGLASLSSWIQLTRDTRNPENDSLYLKVLLENTSNAMKETPKNMFSIVNESVNARCFFGVGITVSSKHLIPYGDFQDIRNNDAETEQLNYIYRGIKDYGVGHVCSVDWDDSQDIKRVWSEFMPDYNVPDVDPVPRKIETNGGRPHVVPRIADTKYLEFKTLSTLSDETDESIINGLRQFTSAYQEWINGLNDAAYPEQANHIKEECLKDYLRMADNIRLLEQPENMTCFRLMNTAMFMQLWHSKEKNQQKFSADSSGKLRVPIDYYKALSGEVVERKGNAAWRSFQLAFILLNLDGIIHNPDDADWDMRNKQVDLVWFPTGGGKTEAYLGIIAFSIIHRRLTTGGNGGGTTAIMRYTLRLLATQQFQRATRLILSLERIRSWDPDHLGNEPISIGLFVGKESLPNNESGDDGLIKEAQKWQEDNPSKIPLDRHRCPWCGGELGWLERRVGRRKEHKFICTKSFCFHDGLPVLLCDEYVYETPPTLLFGTIDKFAMIAHKVSDEDKKNSRRLFSQNGLTPDLIIQDELHLLSGPLGSAAGLFECAIDQLCTREMQVGGRTLKIRPKVISSTATTRNTELQIRALYGRNVNVFPKNGMNYDDSFYAFYKRDADNPDQYASKRKYVGIMPTGRTAMYCQLRLASCFLAHRAIFERDHYRELGDWNLIQAMDYYFTLVSYFNSTKDVGTTDAQFSSEFPKYTRQILKRTIRPDYLLNCYYAYNDSFTKQELTGRLGGEEVVKALNEVQEKWDPVLRDVHVVDGESHSGHTPPDFVLATNMISVGIDVSRFNCMIVNSMPRNKAEYIQATSRVARDEQGVVFTLHNPFRARDVSHFEKFREFHEKLYYYVEPISITPFSKKSIERYLPLYLSAVIRHNQELGLSIDANASSITEEKMNQIEDMVREYFDGLAASCSELSGQLHDVITPDSVNEIIAFVRKALGEWYDRKNGINYFSSTFRNQTESLFTAVDAYEEEKNNTCWVVPTSLRIVPVESVLKIKNV